MPAHLDCDAAERLLLEEVNVRLAIVPPLLKVRPTPLTVLLVHFRLDRVDRKLPQRSVPVRFDLGGRRAEAAVLALADVKVEEVDHRERVAVLVCVEDEPELLEQELGIRFRGVRVDFLVHDEATFSRNGLEDKLMSRGVILARDQLGELGDGLVEAVAGERFRVGVEVDCERVEGREFVHASRRLGDEGRLPLGIGRHGREAGEGQADRERVSRHGEVVLVSDMDIPDLRETQVSPPGYIATSTRERGRLTSIWRLSTILLTKLVVKLWFFCSSSALMPGAGCVESISAFSSFSSFAACARAASSSGVDLDESVGVARRYTFSTSTRTGFPPRFDLRRTATRSACGSP